MRGRVNSVENDRYVRKEFGDNVECTCEQTASATEIQKQGF
jgi:hypothetical protein